MRSISITKYGAPDVLAIKEMPMPEPGSGEVRVRIKATGVNRADVIQRQGFYPPPADVPNDVPGLEFAGEIDAMGPNVSDFTKGDRVYGLAGGGTYAEFVIVHARTLAPIPKDLTFIEAAAIPEVFITAYDAMMQASVQAGEVVLINAVGSGVGTAAVQLCRAIGARSVGTARSEGKIGPAKRLGMEHGIVAAHGQFAEELMKKTHNRGVDVVLELVGGDYLGEDIKCCAYKGRIVLIGLVAGAKTEADLGAILRKRLTIKGTTLRMRPLEEKILATQLLSRNLNPLFEQKVLEPVIDRVLPLEKAAEAHAHMEKNENFGKIILEVT